MAEAQVQRTAQDQGRDKGSETDFGEGARQRLLADMPVTERRLPLAGISTAVLEGGEGPPVVLLHGPMGNATHWMGIIPGLVATHRVIVPDLPGHGISEVTDDGRIDPIASERLQELIEQSCKTPPAMVKMLGGAIAARYAMSTAHRLLRLALVNTFGLRPFQPAPEFGSPCPFPRPADRAHPQDPWRDCAFHLEACATMGKPWEPFEACNLDRARRRAFRPQLPPSWSSSAAAIPAGDLAGSRFNHPDLGPPRPRDPACGGRGGKRALRMAAACDRELQ